MERFLPCFLFYKKNLNSRNDEKISVKHYIYSLHAKEGNDWQFGTVIDLHTTGLAAAAALNETR